MDFNCSCDYTCMLEKKKRKIPGLVLSVCLGLGVPHSLTGRSSSPFVIGWLMIMIMMMISMIIMKMKKIILMTITWEVTEEGGLSGEPSPRFSGEMHGDIGEEGDS